VRNWKKAPLSPYIMMNGAEGKSIFDLCNFLNRRNGHNDNIRGQQWSTFGDYSYVMGRGKRPREIYESEMLILSAYSIQIALACVLQCHSGAAEFSNEEVAKG